MKRFLMIAIVTTLVFVFGLCGCGQQESKEQSSKGKAGEFHLTAGETLELNDEEFAELVEIYMDEESTADNRSIIQFTNCSFAQGMTIIGDRSGWVRLFEGCSFENGSGVTVKEATDGSMKSGKLDDDFIKLFIDVPDVAVENTALLNTISKYDVTVNDVEYKLSDFPDCNIFCVACYYENNKKTVYTEGWVEE